MFTVSSCLARPELLLRELTGVRSLHSHRVSVRMFVMSAIFGGNQKAPHHHSAISPSLDGIKQAT